MKSVEVRSRPVRFLLITRPHPADPGTGGGGDVCRQLVVAEGFFIGFAPMTPSLCRI
jgi:hypothetical protein